MKEFSMIFYTIKNGKKDYDAVIHIYALNKREAREKIQKKYKREFIKWKKEYTNQKSVLLLNNTTNARNCL